MAVLNLSLYFLDDLMSHSTNINNKNNDIEVLRTLAISYVILAHIAALLSPTSVYWKLLEHSKFGSGVDLFFCVSGFIITKSIANKIPEKRSWNSFMEFTIPFWKRRFWRLFPSAFFWILITLIISYFLSNTGFIVPFKVMLKSSFYAVTQTQNFNFIECRPAGSCGELGIYWSLSLENQFYLLLPLLAFFFRKRNLIIFFSIVFASQFFIPRTLNAETPFMWSLRTDAISLGVLVALLSNGKNYNKLAPTFLENKYISSLFFILICIVLALLASPNATIDCAVGLTAITSSILVFCASFNKQYFSTNIFVKKTCNYIGSRSYSIYLTHVIAISLTKVLFFSTNTSFDGFSTGKYIVTFSVLTLLMSEFNYRVIEMPLRKLGKKPFNTTKKEVTL